MKATTSDRQFGFRANQRKRSLARSSLVLAALGFVFGFVRPTLSGPKPAASLTVLMYNYAEVSPATLATAEREAFKILGAAGVRVVWVDCLEKLPSSESKELCQRGWSAQTPGLRLLSGHVTGMYEDREFGFAAIPALATVNYERIEAWYGRDAARDVLPIMLGCVMAHELGHLLLRDRGHSTIGIMQPRFGDEQMRQALTARLRFTSQQAKLIREHALTLNTANEGYAHDNRTHPIPPEPTKDFPTRTAGDIPYAGTISLHEMSIPDKARKAYNKGVQQFSANDWGRSVLNAQRAIKFAPAFYEAYNLLGLAEARLENWDLAEAAYRKSIELSGDTFATPHFGLGMVLSQRAQFVEAEATILEGLRLDPADAKGHCGLALVLYLMGRFPEAERSAREAIRYQSTYSMPYFLLAKINHLRGNPAAEIEDLKNYLKLEPPLSTEARAALAAAQRSSAKENTAMPTKP